MRGLEAQEAIPARQVSADSKGGVGSRLTSDGPVVGVNVVQPVGALSLQRAGNSNISSAATASASAPAVQPAPDCCAAPADRSRQKDGTCPRSSSVLTTASALVKGARDGEVVQFAKGIGVAREFGCGVGGASPGRNALSVTITPHKPWAGVAGRASGQCTPGPHTTAGPASATKDEVVFDAVAPMPCWALTWMARSSLVPGRT